MADVKFGSAVDGNEGFAAETAEAQGYGMGFPVNDGTPGVGLHILLSFILR